MADMSQLRSMARLEIPEEIVSWLQEFVKKLEVEIFPALRKAEEPTEPLFWVDSKGKRRQHHLWPSEHKIWSAKVPSELHARVLENYCDRMRIPCYHVAECSMTFSYSYLHLSLYEGWR